MVAARADAATAQRIGEVSTDHAARIATGIEQLDLVLGGGLVPGAVVLMGGEPGAGKSTLVLQAAHAVAVQGRSVLYATGEESAEQVALRARRLRADAAGLLLAATTDVVQLAALVGEHQPSVVVVDSVQTMRHPDHDGIVGGTTQVRAAAALLTELAKRLGAAMILVGHVTKEGTLAGPRVLEHLVDVVCELDGDRHHAVRLLCATKNRYGAAGVVGCFEMTGAGLQSVRDASRLFVGDGAAGTPGVALTLAVHGNRPLACEVQALTVRSNLTHPRRVTSGLDPTRVDLILAVLERHADVRLADHDVYTSTIGGIRLADPAVDLALAVALASARLAVPAAAELVVLGELGLAGEVRRVAHTEQRLTEAARLGISRALLPAAYDGPDQGLRLLRAHDLPQALRAALPGGTFPRSEPGR